MNIPFDVQSNMEATQCRMCINVRKPCLFYIGKPEAGNDLIYVYFQFEYGNITICLFIGLV